MTAAELAHTIDRLLRTEAFHDDSLNGLQVDGRGKVETVAFAVDASLGTIRQASENGAQFLLVHHGLFWGKPLPITGLLYERIKTCVENNLALYASHLPLDAHPKFGNNARLVKRLGWKNPDDFGQYHGHVIGKKVRFRKSISIHQLADRIREKLKCEPVLWQFGPTMSKGIAVVSGGALSMLEQVADSGCDTLLTGEPDHAHYWTAKECGLNILFGGHYCTETLGVKALQTVIQSRLSLHTVFIDNPTGY
jgi:dinuclear metal center YbgI/SA1388 family protein